MKFTESTYLNYNPFIGADRDADIRQYSWKLVKTRIPHLCMLAELVGCVIHEIPKGQLAMRERAIVDNEWGSSYSCIDCMDKWLIDEVEIENGNA